MNAQDLYLRTFDPTGKSSAIISYHRVWDAKLFLASTRAQYEKKRDTEDFREIVLVEESDYRKSRNYKVL